MVPAVAAGQSAGDDQYADPFEKEQVQGSPAPQSQSQNQESSPGQVQGSPASGSSGSTTSQGSAQRLAYTGFNLPLLFVAGAVMLLAGFTVRRAISSPYATPS
jgi:hypothetical protein